MVLEPPKTVSILGSTGSIGCSTVDLLVKNPHKFNVVALSANQNVELLAQQALALHPDFIALNDESQYLKLKDLIGTAPIEIAVGPDAVIEAARRDADWVMASIVGSAGLAPTLAAIERGAVIGLANKESLVCAGHIMRDAVEHFGATLLPVDSEHNAIFQVLDFETPQSIEKITLTASGGPFLNRSIEQMRTVTPEQAVAHPNWSMGAKISIDSATMMNKGLELIEAFHLFPVSEEQIDILVHPQSVIHSMVSYIDGSVLAQLGSPDMRTPIGYALAWPERMPTPSAKLDLAEIATLSFEKPDPVRFRALSLARDALKSGQSAPATLNGANEEAVAAFLNRQIGFLDIAAIVEEVLERMDHQDIKTIECVHEIDRKAREIARLAIAKKTKTA